MRISSDSISSFSEDQVPHFNSILFSIIQALNSLEFGNGTTPENMWCVFATITTPTSADTSFTIAHTLGKVPIGFIPIKMDRACSLYTSPASAWTSSNICLKCNTASASGVIILI